MQSTARLFSTILDIEGFERLDIVASNNTTPTLLADFVSDSDLFEVDCVANADFYICVAVDASEANTNLGDKTKSKLVHNGETFPLYRGSGTKKVWVRSPTTSALTNAIEVTRLVQAPGKA